MVDLLHFTSGKELSYGECLDPAMRITDPADAAAYLAAYEGYIVEYGGLTPDEAHQCALTNIGYFAGYYSFETRQRMERLFGAVHLVIGTASNGEPSTSELLQMGKDLIDSNSK